MKTYEERKLLIRDLIRAMGDNPYREGLRDTPRRVIKSWSELFAGYDMDAETILATSFEPTDDGTTYDQIILLRDIEMYSHCLAGSTFVETPKGRIPINRLRDGEYVYAWDEDANRPVVTRCSSPRVTGVNQPLWRVYTDKDTMLCTGDHKLLSASRGWVKAEDLRVGESIVALNRGVQVAPGQVPRAYLKWNDGGHRYEPEHRFVYEQIHGAVDGLHIHHLDHRPNNNSPTNLRALEHGEHSRHHRMCEDKTGFARISNVDRRKFKSRQVAGVQASQTPEVRAKRAQSLRDYWASLSPQQRAERNHRVLLVEATGWFEDVWCMDVPGYFNFIANGMVVHNCEHHMLPFFGRAHVAYMPGDHGRVVGISKLARLVECYSRRLQIQERIGQQVVSAIDLHLKSLGSACIIEAQHLCMMCRGVSKQYSKMVTSYVSGVFRDDPNIKSELFNLIGPRQ